MINQVEVAYKFTKNEDGSYTLHTVDELATDFIIKAVDKMNNDRIKASQRAKAKSIKKKEELERQLAEHKEKCGGVFEDEVAENKELVLEELRNKMGEEEPKVSKKATKRKPAKANTDVNKIKGRTVYFYHLSKEGDEEDNE